MEENVKDHLGDGKLSKIQSEAINTEGCHDCFHLLTSPHVRRDLIGRNVKAK